MNSLERFQIVYNFIKPFLDIGILTYIIYKAYTIIVKTNGVQILRVVITFALAFGIATALQLTTLINILNAITPGLLVCFAIVFQPELRKIFLKLGQNDWFKLGTRSKHTYVDSVLIAAEMLSKQKRGMLVVFNRKQNLKDLLDTGTKLNADLTSSLLVTIFGHDTPLHDGAVIIQSGKILGAGCFLPLSKQHDIMKTFGTRHRAAIGVTEETDALVLVVSEETGAISIAYDSKLYYDLTMEQLTKTLEAQLEITPESYTEEDATNDTISKAWKN